MLDQKPIESSEIETEDAVTSFSKWLASTTGNNYTIVERELIKDTLLTFDRYINLTNEINNDFNKKWGKILAMLKV